MDILLIPLLLIGGLVLLMVVDLASKTPLEKGGHTYQTDGTWWEAFDVSPWNDLEAESLLRIFLFSDSVEITARQAREAQDTWPDYDWWHLIERLAGDTGTSFSWRQVIDEMKSQVEDEAGHPIEWTR